MSRVIHFEIHASQPEVLIAFYSKLFGWQINKVEWMDYWLIDTGSPDQPGIGGAILQRPECIRSDSTMVNAFVCTVDVTDLDHALETGLALGAEIQMPKGPVPGIGWLAYIKDPDGNLLGLLQPDEQAG